MQPNDAEDDAARPHSNAASQRDAHLLIHGLRQLAVDTDTEMSPDLHARLMARVQALPPLRQPFWRRWQSWGTQWAPVLAVGLLLSLGGNLWWGIQETRTPVSVMALPLRTWQFQQQLIRSTVVGAVLPTESDVQGYGLAPLPVQALFVRLGTGYAETLALMQSGQQGRIAQHMATLMHILETTQAPDVLAAYLRALQTLGNDPQYTNAMLTQLLALFESLYEEAYAQQSEGSEALLLFRLGAWLATLELAVQAGDPAALHQEQAVQYFRHALAHLDVQPTVLEAFERLHRYITRPTMDAQDRVAMRTLVQTLQRTLSN